MRACITTSDAYHHILKVSCYLLEKNWPEQEFDVVGYKTPNFILPDNFNFISLGEQIGGPENFSGDLRKYFETQDQFFIWLFDDCVVKSINKKRLDTLELLTGFENNVGRINLSDETMKQDHQFYMTTGEGDIYENTQTANYRLSTQPSIWNRGFLLKYLTPGLTPWKFETQSSINDGYKILGFKKPAIEHNEGVRKHDIFKYDLNGVDSKQIEEMKQLNII